MCGRGGKSVDAYYEEIKPEPMALPSLSMTGKKSDRQKPQYGAFRTGAARRSLLMPYTVDDQNV